MAITGNAATFAALRVNSPKDHSCLLARNRVSLRVPTSPNPEMGILVSTQGNLSSLRGGTGLLERPTFDQSQFDPVPEAQEAMIQLLFSLLAAEVVLVFVLLFKTPLRKLAIMGLDRLKRGRGPVLVKTVAGTVVVVLASSVYSMTRIRSRSEEGGAGLTPTDQVLMSRHLLEASLMGYALLLALIIDRLHHYIRELRGLRKSVEAVMKQNRALEESKSGGSDDIKAKDKEIASLNEQIKVLKSESAERLKEAKTAEANALALKKQSEGFLLEYDRLLEDNQNLRSQLQSIDLRLSHSDSKKST